MNSLTLIGVGAAAVIFLLSLYLIWSERYEDGLFGRLFLAGLSLSCLVLVLDAIFGRSQYSLLPSTAMTLLCVAGFMARHVYRFRRWVAEGKNDWRGDKS